MSEYQYYAFLALDRPLTAKERAELWLSSPPALRGALIAGGLGWCRQLGASGPSRPARRPG